MSELRWDSTLCEWVTYAPQRQERTFLPPAEWCPLCPTKPGGIPTEVPRESYEIVVFENRFPSYTLDAECPPDASTALSPVAPGRGVCEVVLYSDVHTATLARMPVRRIRDLIAVWADRYRELGALDAVRYVLIFENKGEAIGVTLHHPHGQIYGYPFLPPRPARELAAARAFRTEHSGGCLHCALLEQEHRDGRRMLVAGTHFSAFVPFTAHYPYEIHIYANRCAPSIADLTAGEHWDLARVLKRVLTSYDALWGFSLPYMMVLHQAPTDGMNYNGLAHFHIEFYPPNRTHDKLKYLAGSEVGAGAFIVDALPEETAARLRAALARAPEDDSDVGDR